MTSKTFKKKLARMIDDGDEFATDLIDMTGISTPVDEVMYVAGEGENEVFLIHIQKIKV